MAVATDTLLVAAVLGSLGALLWGASLWIFLRQQRELRRFESTTGEVVTAELGPASPPWYSRLLATSAEDATVDHVSGVARTEHQRGDVPVVEYEYAVAGETYTSDTLWPAGIEPVSDRLLSGPDNFARQVVSRYVAGDEVTVYYDPDEPDVAFLRRDRNVVGPMALLIVGMLPVAYVTQVLA